MSNFANDFKIIVGYNEFEEPIYREMSFEDVQNLFPDSFDQVMADDILAQIVVPCKEGVTE